MAHSVVDTSHRNAMRCKLAPVTDIYTVTVKLDGVPPGMVLRVHSYMT
jgi:hypothetical protein